MYRFCKRVVSNAFSSSYSAKMFVLFIGYVSVLCVTMPSAIMAIYHYDSVMAGQEMEVKWLQYGYLIFLPFIKLITWQVENFLGILVLLFALMLSDRVKIFQHYVLLLLLYLLSAYPSLIYGGLVPGFYSSVLEALAMVSDGKYMLLFAFYGSGIVWIFLALAMFDVAFYYAKRVKHPRIVWENLAFSLVLYVAIFGIYSYDRGSLVLY